MELKKLRWIRTILAGVMVFYGLTCFAKGDGLSIETSLGAPGVVIENPDGTEAAFDGRSMSGKLSIPITDDAVSTFFNLSYRYHDLENTDVVLGTELAKHEGYGVGFSLKFSPLLFGLEYNKMNAKHYLVSTTSNQIDFSYNLTSVILGYMQQVGGAAIGVTYVMGQGKIASDETGFSSDSNVKEQTVYLTLQYTLKSSIGDVGKKLVSK